MTAKRNKSTGSNTIPVGWRILRLDEIADVVGGSTPSRSKPSFWSGSIPWVVPSEVSQLNGRYLRHTRDMITETGARSASLKTLPAGSVLLTTRATIGAVAICSAPTTTNQGFQSLVPHNGTDSLWLFYRVRALTHEFTRRAAGSTFREVSRQSVRGVPVPFPPLAEQQAIAEVLDAIDGAIERTDEVIAATELLREALLHELLTKGLPGWHTEWQDTPASASFPADWQRVRLGDVLTLEYGTSLPMSKRRIGSIPVVGSAGVIGQHDRAVVQGPGIVIGRKGSIGSVTWINANFVPIDTTYYVIKAVKHLDLRYAFWLLGSENLSRLNRATGIPGLNRDDVYALRTFLPPLAEQRVICTVLDGVDSAIEQTGREKAALAAFKESISDALLTGRVRVPVRT